MERRQGSSSDYSLASEQSGFAQVEPFDFAGRSTRWAMTLAAKLSTNEGPPTPSVPGRSVPGGGGGGQVHLTTKTRRGEIYTDGAPSSGDPTRASNKRWARRDGVVDGHRSDGRPALGALAQVLTLALLRRREEGGRGRGGGDSRRPEPGFEFHLPEIRATAVVQGEYLTSPQEGC